MGVAADISCVGSSPREGQARLVVVETKVASYVHVPRLRRCTQNMRVHSSTALVLCELTRCIITKP